jgi:betaine-homocysteine S-methyltransferase
LNGPAQQLPIAREMRNAVGGYVASQPVAYRTTADQPDFTSFDAFPTELDPMQLSRSDMSTFARQANDLGINYIGSCCGSVQGHVRAMGKVLGKVPSEEREWRSTTGKAMSAYEYHEHEGLETP